MPSHSDTKNELAERVIQLRALLARREAQNAPLAILETIRRDLKDAGIQLRDYDRSHR